MSKELTSRGVYANYGVRAVGGLSGRQKTHGSEEELVFELVAGDTIEDNYDVALPPFYLVESIYVEVEEAFAVSSTADLSIDGGAGLTTDIDLSSTGISSVSTAGLANTEGGSTSVDIGITPNANAVASGTGKARVLVKYKNM